VVATLKFSLPMFDAVEYISLSTNVMGHISVHLLGYIFVTGSDKTDHFAQKINFKLATLHQSALYYL